MQEDTVLNALGVEGHLTRILLRCNKSFTQTESLRNDVSMRSGS